MNNMDSITDRWAKYVTFEALPENRASAKLISDAIIALNSTPPDFMDGEYPPVFDVVIRVDTFLNITRDIYSGLSIKFNMPEINPYGNSVDIVYRGVSKFLILNASSESSVLKFYYDIERDENNGISGELKIDITEIAPFFLKYMID